MQLEEFYDYKNQLMGDILTEESIIHLINPDIPLKKAKTLAYKQVFPYEYLPDTVEEGKTFVCFEVDVIKDNNRARDLMRPVIYIWVFSHKSNLRLPEGGVRTDKLCSEICKKINGSMFYGQGALTLDSAKRFAPMTDFNGKVMTFYTKDFSKVYNPKKSIPTRRKN